MLIDVITIFPDYFAPLGVSLLGKARERGLLDVRVHDLREWTTDVHRSVDDTPYGGGPGMVMRPEPWAAALSALVAVGGPAGVPGRPRLILPTPSGRPFTQTLAAELATEPWLVFGCGRYEGIDARVAQFAAERMPVDEISIGDYVLAGGEVATLVVIEAVTRLLPGVVGNEASVADDSFAPGSMAGLVEGPVYTRPARWQGRDVPAVLLSGDHAAIARWRRDEALRRTAGNRPDLLVGATDALGAAAGKTEHAADHQQDQADEQQPDQTLHGESHNTEDHG
ncbi:MAG: tRNA (guanosine(37)-N1)-methyltransferase TrmD [Mycobacteriales bacterium]